MVKPSHLLSTNTGPMGPPGPPILCPFILWLVVVVASGQEADVVVVKVTSNHHGNNDARTSWLVNGGSKILDYWWTQANKGRIKKLARHARTKMRVWCDYYPEST